MQKTIIVTGAGSGIGKATATAFLENGYKVGFLGRRAATLESAANGHKNALILPCDVSDPNDVETAFATATASWGRLDVLFNNAG
ncbi:MAG: SDR family oxidoreductase, partial [Candidatus Puniceispirillaceae bacterium]